MVDFKGGCQKWWDLPVRPDGLAREGNLDILMSWGRIVTYWYVDMSDIDILMVLT